MAETSAWMVILAKPMPRDPVALAKVLAAARKTPMQDQMMTAKNGWGVLAEHLTEAEAAALAQALENFGVKVLACTESSFFPLPEPAAVGSVDSLLATTPCLIAASAITFRSSTTKTVKEGPSAAQKVLSTAILLGTGLPIKIGGKTRTVLKTQEHSDLLLFLDLVYQNPLRHLRIDAQKFDYSFLKERKQYQILGNFRLLVGDLVKAAPSAGHTHGTAVLLEGKPLQTMGYESLDHAQREMRWLLTLQSLQS